MIVAPETAAWSGERVTRRAVIDHWLATECRKQVDLASENAVDAVAEHDVGLLGKPLETREPGAAAEGGDTIADRIGALSEEQALDALLRRKPGAAAFLWRARPIEWTRVRMTQTEFARLQYVAGPENLGWRALAPSGRIVDGARRIAGADGDSLEAETSVDVARVCAIAETLADGEKLDALVLTTRRGQAAPTVADGNHRATAIALHALRTGEYRPQRAYLGVGANPILRPLRQRLRGVLSRFRLDESRW